MRAGRWAATVVHGAPAPAPACGNRNARHGIWIRDGRAEKAVVLDLTGIGPADHPLPIMSKISVVTVTSSSTHGVTAFTHRFPCPSRSTASASYGEAFPAPFLRRRGPPTARPHEGTPDTARCGPRPRPLAGASNAANRPWERTALSRYGSARHNRDFSAAIPNSSPVRAVWAGRTRSRPRSPERRARPPRATVGPSPARTPRPRPSAPAVAGASTRRRPTPHRCTRAPDG